MIRNEYRLTTQLQVHAKAVIWTGMGCLVSIAFSAAAESYTVTQAEVIEAIPIAEVWAGHPVGFDLRTPGNRQYAAYYDAARRMTVAARNLGDTVWDYAVLPEQIGWDSHNYIVMTTDDDGYLHLSGNMHNDPLVYFRTTVPGDIQSFERITVMTGEREQRVTYPKFMRGPANELIFTYRDGGSGRGDQLYNVYDHATQRWRRLLDTPLTDGEGERNAYFDGPHRGPDGFFHLCWVWRDTSDCATNHSLSYARSLDLRTWENSRGETLELPITFARSDIVDPVPPGGGIINGNAKVGFDDAGRVVLSYHKFDSGGLTQACQARLEDGQWRIYQSSDWEHRWEFSGGGAIVFNVRIGKVRHDGSGRLLQDFSHWRHGSGSWQLDPDTLRPVATIPRLPHVPRESSRPRNEFPEMQVRWHFDAGQSEDSGVRYALRWETLPQNRDHPREGELPGPSTLELYAIKPGTITFE